MARPASSSWQMTSGVSGPDAFNRPEPEHPTEMRLRATPDRVQSGVIRLRAEIDVEGFESLITPLLLGAPSMVVTPDHPPTDRCRLREAAAESSDQDYEQPYSTGPSGVDPSAQVKGFSRSRSPTALATSDAGAGSISPSSVTTTASVSPSPSRSAWSTTPSPSVS